MPAESPYQRILRVVDFLVWTSKKRNEVKEMEKYQMEKSEEEKATYFVDEETLTKEELDQVFDGKGAEQYHEDAGV